MRISDWSSDVCSSDLAGTARRGPLGERAGCGHEVVARVLGVDAELDGVPADLGVAVAELLASGDAEHLADQVDAGDFLGDAVLDLEAGVDLEERDGAVCGDQELAGSGTSVRSEERRVGKECVSTCRSR